MSKSMTSERAIEILKSLTFVKVLENNVHSNIAYHSKSACKKDNEDFAAIQMAISALEKQIPKKPISIKNDEDVRIGSGTWKAGVTVYKCPCCNSFISRSSDFCNKCGQNLDWSDEE